MEDRMYMVDLVPILTRATGAASCISVMYVQAALFLLFVTLPETNTLATVYRLWSESKCRVA